MQPRYCLYSTSSQTPGGIRVMLPESSSRRPAYRTRKQPGIWRLFHTRDLLAIDLDKRYQYRPASEILAAHVRTLSQAYNERPVTLIRMIYALRDLKIQSFADAFKLRGK